MLRSFFCRAPRGSSWVMVLLIALAFMFFGNMLLRMFFSIAFSVVTLAIQVGVFVFIILALLFAIRVLSGGKPEAK
jgi:hypothetical protein